MKRSTMFRRVRTCLLLMLLLPLLLLLPVYVTRTAPAARNYSGFVSLCPGRMNGNHRAGNHLFMFAAMIYFSERTNREIIMKPTGWSLDDVFDMDAIRRFNATSGVPLPERILQPPGIYNADPVLDDATTLANFTEKTVSLCGLYQTSRYADAFGSELRRALVIKAEARRDADLFFDLNRPTKWKPGSYVKVGIHVRRGDFLTKSEQAFGLTVVTESYLNNSMRYFTSRHERVHFIVTSDDIAWTKAAVVSAFAVDKSTAVDNLQAYRQLPIRTASSCVL